MLWAASYVQAAVGASKNATANLPAELLANSKYLVSLITKWYPPSTATTFTSTDSAGFSVETANLFCEVSIAVVNHNCFDKLAWYKPNL